MGTDAEVTFSDVALITFAAEWPDEVDAASLTWIWKTFVQIDTAVVLQTITFVALALVRPR